MRWKKVPVMQDDLQENGDRVLSGSKSAGCRGFTTKDVKCSKHRAKLKELLTGDQETLS